MSRRSVAMRLLAMLRPMSATMAVSVVCRVVSQGLGVVIAAGGAALVVTAAEGGPKVAPVGVLVGAALLKGLFRYLEQFTGHAVAFRLLVRLRVDTYRSIAPLAPAGLEEERTGDLVRRVVGDVDRVEPFFAHTIAPLAGAVLVPAMTAAMLAVAVDPTVAVTFVIFPVIMTAVVPWVAARPVAALSAESRRLSGEAGALLTDAVQGSRELAALDAGGIVDTRLDRAAASTGEVRRRLGGIAAVKSTVVDLLGGGAVIAVAAVAASRYSAGMIDLTGLVVAIIVAWVGTAPARVLEDVVPDVAQALAAAGRLFDLADREPPVRFEERDSGEPPAGPVGFDRVTVAIGGRPVLSEVWSEIAPGSMVALVGPSGSGKTTLVELLVRFRDPDSGRVLLAGKDLRHLPEQVLRDAVTLVVQRPDVFFGTVATNLRLAAPGATAAALWAVLERVGLAEWVRSLPGGLEAPVGERGETMSGGQRQRLAIARALLRDARVLALDEATSELDGPAERQIAALLEEERGRRTVVVVAHRLETVTAADEILVLDRGRIVERGSHRHLVDRDGVYAGLWQRHQDLLEA